MLAGCNQKRKGIANGCFYKVLAVNEAETVLLNLDASEAPKRSTAEETAGETDTDNESIADTAGAAKATATLPTGDLSSCLRLAHCLTYSACQSRTLHGRLRLHEVSHLHFTKRHLNVGLSRGTSCDLIDLHH